jgi:hypothetical protein
MTPTGPRSHTDLDRHRGPRHRPGTVPGRWRIGRCLGICLAGIVQLTPTASSAQFQELFSWWRRELLPLSLDPGSWIALERIEAAEGQVVTDTLTCQVLDAAGDTYWVEVDASGADTGWILHVDLERLARADVDLFDSLLDLWYVREGGQLERENLDELGESRMVRRHLEDLFVDPEVQRSALPDSTVHGATVGRERVVLQEKQETVTPMGGRTLAHVTDVRSEAVISPAVPVFGLLSASTSILVRSEWRSDGDVQRGPPPLMTEIRIRCLDFGRHEPAPLRPELRSR